MAKKGLATAPDEQAQEGVSLKTKALAVGAGLAMLASGAVAGETQGRLDKLLAEHGDDPEVQEIIKQAKAVPKIYEVLNEGERCTGFSEDKKENFKLVMACHGLDGKIDNFYLDEDIKGLRKDNEQLKQEFIDTVRGAVAMND